MELVHVYDKSRIKKLLVLSHIKINMLIKFLQINKKIRRKTFKQEY
jgi:hypothetical protein